MKQIFGLLLILTLSISGIQGQYLPVLIEAETGTLGAEYEIGAEGEITYISPTTDLINSTNPGSSARTSSYTVTFEYPGTYKLYARILVEEDFDDDSYFYSNGFGAKDPIMDNDWIPCNGLAAAGYTIPGDVVEEQGDAGAGIWKWVNFSEFTGYGTPVKFTVNEGDLVQTFEIGAREDGFSIDRFAFGIDSLYFTVDNLNKGEAGSSTHPTKIPIGPPLANGLDKFLGCSFGSDSQRDIEGYWNQITPGNGGKWGWVEGTRDNMNWTDLDAAYTRAMENDFVYKHHVMVWGSQQPSWTAALDSAEQRGELEEWFAAVAERYPGLDQVEVVNEPLHAPPDRDHQGGYIDALGGSGDTGWDWILESFRMARNVFADTTVLMINEYSIMNSNSNTDRYLEIIELLMAEDLIDAIGFQAHGFSHTASNAAYLRNINVLASTGLPIYVTELDIDGLTDIQQVHGYMNLFPLLWEHQAIQGITLWGYRPSMWRGDKGAYLIDDYGIERPAMRWLRAYLNNSFVPNEAINITSEGDVTSIDVSTSSLQFSAEVLPDTSTLNSVSWSVSNSTKAEIDQNGKLIPKKAGIVTVTAKSMELGTSVTGQMQIEITDTSTVVKQISGSNALLVYPNPAVDGRFNINGIEDMSTLMILDMNGRKVVECVLNRQNSIELDLQVPNGLYIIRLTDGKKVYHSKITII